MKSAYLGLFAAGGAYAAILTEMAHRNIQVAAVDATAHIDNDRQEVVFRGPTSDMESLFRCSSASNKRLTFTADHAIVACCLPGQSLRGSLETAFDCCNEDQQLIGSNANGYRCCRTGQTFDGTECKDPQKPTEPVVCPPGPTTKPVVEPKECTSGVSAGKCYLMEWENDPNLAYQVGGAYSLMKNDNRYRQPGKFKLCKDESCSARSQVNPNDEFRIMDLHGGAFSGRNSGKWLDGTQNGGVVGRTSDYTRAGIFTVTKWAKGKYCLGGFKEVLGMDTTCPGNSNAFDNQFCVPLEMVEVPCDIHDVHNNCLWSKDDNNNGSSGGKGDRTPSVSCPPGTNWNGRECEGQVTCPPNTNWNGKSCQGRDDGGNTGDRRCPAGANWNGERCIKPITDCADRARPDLGDTSYNEDQFPCSKGKEKPCRGSKVQDWTSAKLPWGGQYSQPGPPKPYETTVNFDFPVIMSIVDVEAQSEHFLVKLDGEFLGETGGENGYKNVYIGNYNDPEWCLTNGYTRGYFLIPAGNHRLTVEWPQGTGKYKTESGGAWWYGIAKYRFDRLCDSSNCTPVCQKKN